MTNLFFFNIYYLKYSIAEYKLLLLTHIGFGTKSHISQFL